MCADANPATARLHLLQRSGNESRPLRRSVALPAGVRRGRQADQHRHECSCVDAAAVNECVDPADIRASPCRRALCCSFVIHSLAPCCRRRRKDAGILQVPGESSRGSAPGELGSLLQRYVHECIFGRLHQRFVVLDDEYRRCVTAWRWHYRSVSAACERPSTRLRLACAAVSKAYPLSSVETGSSVLMRRCTSLTVCRMIRPLVCFPSWSLLSGLLPLS